MPKFRIIEAQDITYTRIWIHEIEADNEEAALEIAMQDEGDAEIGGSYGNEEFGDSGFAIVVNGNDQAARDAAFLDLMGAAP